MSHTVHPHCEALKKNNQEASQSTIGRDGSVFVFNPDVLREQFAGLVIQRGLSFNHFDDEQTTRVLQNTMQQRYNHVSRITLKRDAMKLCVAAKQAIINGFLNLNTNVNRTTDVWSALHGLPSSYICVIAHWIEPGIWQMMKRVIAFKDFSVSHTGSALARVLRKTFINFNLEDKIMSITLDNASNNTSEIGKLKLKYEPSMDDRRVLSIPRTKLTPASLEMCMCLKDHLDAQERKQDKFSLENAVDFEEEILDAGVQQNEAIPLSEEEIALDVAGSKGTMSGSGPGREDVDYDMTNYGDDYK
nr:zinc finger BED domain-containing protein DAYSLEEPER [Tanacetum cinerariifolium]